MNVQHTPGPWIVSGREMSDVRDQDNYIVACAFHVRYNYRCRPVQEAAANARLIAAAPDLLQALIDVVGLAKEMHEHWDNDRDMKVGKYLLALSGMLPGYDGRTEDVHKAITKAIGIA